MQVLDEVQVTRFLAAAPASPFLPLNQLMITTGMRQMEILGLKWTDLDWIKCSLKVERQLIWEDGVQFSPPKTRNGRRTVVLGDQSIKVLRRHFERQNIERKKAGKNRNEFDLVFTSAVGTPIHFRNLLKDYKNLLNIASLPDIRFHDLRYTAAALMLNHGIPVIIVSIQLATPNLPSRSIFMVI